jgi:hypothetical protein
LTLIKQDANGVARLLYVEVKTATGRLRAAQRVWLALLAAVPGVEVYVWRPANWQSIVATLQGEHT